MVGVELYINGKRVQEFIFYNLLDGLMYIMRNNIKFDYIVVDNETRVSRCQFRRYIQTINEHCWKIYGYMCTTLNEELRQWS